MVQVVVTPEIPQESTLQHLQSMTFAEAKTFLRESTDLGEDEEDIKFQVGVLLLMGLARPKRAAELARLTKYDREFVEMIADNLRKAGIWVGEDTATFANWAHSPVSFMIDILVGLGTLELVAQAPN